MSVEQTYSWLGKAASIDDLALYIVPLFQGWRKRTGKAFWGTFSITGCLKT